MIREHTNKLVAMIDDGILDANAVALACIKYMSEADVQDMMESEGCHYDADDWLTTCKNAPSCAGIIWVESTES